MKLFTERFLAHVDERGDAPALELSGAVEGHAWSYRDLADRVGRVARWLRDSGVEPGQRCALLGPGTPSFCAAYLGALCAGVVVVPLDPQIDDESIASLIAAAAPAALMADSARLERLCSAWEAALPRARHPLDRQAIESLPPAPLAPAALDATADALLLYTSGTTNQPKGVRLTQGNLAAAIDGLLDSLPVGADDRVLGILPLFHILAQLTNLLIPLSVGASVVMLAEVTPASILEALAQEHITAFCCVPRFFYLVHERVQQRAGTGPKRVVFRVLLAINLALRRTFGLNIGPRMFGRVHEVFGDSMRLLVTGGGPFDPAVARDFYALGFELLQGYGLTECVGTATITRVGTGHRGSAGTPIQGVQIALHQPDAEGLGEVLIRGANVMPGYADEAEATADVVRDGWLHTGDLGRIAEDGSLYITGRLKELIVLSTGKKIEPLALEAHYAASPWIEELCVLGRAAPDGRGDVLHAVIVPSMEQARSHGGDVRARIRREMEDRSARLPPSMRVASWELRTEPLPRTTTHKLRRHEVAARMRGSDAASATRVLTEAERAWVEDPAHAPALRAVAEISRFPGRTETPGEPALHPDMHLDIDLGLDSLARLELLDALESRLGIRLRDETTRTARTVRELVELAVSAPVGGHAPRAAPLWEQVLAAEAGGELVRELPPRPGLVTVIASRIAWLFALLLLWLRVRGSERIPVGPVIFCPNHRSVMDGGVLTMALPGARVRRLVHVARPEHFRSFPMRALRRQLGVLLVDEAHIPEIGLATTAAALRAGRSAVVFPEGTRSLDGHLGPLRPGAALLCAHTGVPIVPVAIEGTERVWPRGRGPRRPARVRVTFGEPVRASPGESTEELTKRVRVALETLLRAA